MRDFKNNKKNNFNRDDHRSDRRNFKNEKPARVRDRGYKNDEENDEYLSNLIIGRNPVLEALKSDKQIDKVFVDDNAGGSIVQIIKLAKEKGIVIKSVTPQKLDAMSRGGVHQGVCATGACAEYKTPEEILEIAKNKGEEPFIIICDEIEDPHNLGAIIRTAECAGAHGVIIPKRRSASLNITVFKTSAGAASVVPVARVSNIAQTIDYLKENGVWIYGTDASGSDYTEVDFSGGVGIVIGSEGFGMGRLIKDKCDYLLRLPLKGQITSLNASVAGGIFMYEVVRQRDLKKG
ncbi:MAG: 23S rRNA (guanosine(2251)-2'-O)-methyltransferase RlmB [Oscillospiraceae bacterium]|nr:23S rRNA (guanosine(2251)-2'-O)-methyltransferase RlmB [Oscillospiraceae bacterium]